MKRMYLELTKLTDKQLDRLRFFINEEVGGRNSRTMRKQKPTVRAPVPMNKCVVLEGGKKGTPYLLGYEERRPQ